jgi:hypothetical protein
LDELELITDGDIKQLDWVQARKKPIVIIAALITKSPIYIHTLEGVMRGEVGDWLLKGVNGEYYPCKSDIFRKTYDVLERE